MREVFELLDIQGDGELEQHEFVEGIMEIFMLDMPIETIQILKFLRTTIQIVSRSQSELQDLKESLTAVTKELRQQDGKMNAELVNIPASEDLIYDPGSDLRISAESEEVENCRI